jgi:hypothetical protein
MGWVDESGSGRVEAGGHGISVIAMMAGGIKLKSYSDVREFEAAIAREVPGFQRLPPLPPAATRR